MQQRITKVCRNNLLTVLALASMYVLPAQADPEHATAPATASEITAPPRATMTRPARKISPYHAVSGTEQAKAYYQVKWGVDHLRVQRTASGNLIRFSYRVGDPDKARVLGDKAATPVLIGQRSRAVLQIPVMDKVGALRQAGIPIAGKEYWMTFSNKGDLVKRGDRVNVVIGSFHADGLAVE